jgi:DNA end-binding protein Ku
VDLSEVSSLYLETSYYVTPQKDTDRAYEVLLAAFAESKKAAIVRFVGSGRQNYAVVQAIDGVLVFHPLYYNDEVRTLEVSWKRPTPQPAGVRLARDFIDALTKHFDPVHYHDEYRERLAALIEAKAHGQTMPMPTAPAAPVKVVNLMEALRQSVELVKKPPAKVEAVRKL